MAKTPHALDRVLTWALQPWAMDPTQMAIIAHVLQRRLTAGPHALSPAQLTALLPARADEGDDDEGTGDPRIAILPVRGVIAPRMTMMSDISGGTTFEGIRGQLAKATADPAVETIILDINSPGGSVAGATTAAAAVRKARDVKRVIAHIDPCGTSAAYWLAAGATEVVAAPLSHVSSIGVYTMHDNIAGLLTKEGIERTMIGSGEGKLDGNPFEALSERATKRMQALVDQARAVFVNDVAAGRTRARADVEAWAAHCYTAEDALPLGIIDRIETLEETLARFGASPSLADTPQEPVRLSGQDRIAEQRALEHAMWRLAFTSQGVTP